MSGKMGGKQRTESFRHSKLSCLARKRMNKARVEISRLEVILMHEWAEGKTENKSLEYYLLNVPFSGVR